MTPKIEWCNYPDAGSMCPNCGKFVNGVNPYDDGETWMK